MQSVILYLTIILSSLNPLGLSWEKEYNKNKIPEISGYKYYYGSIDWGQIIYISSEDILQMESEIQLYFDGGKISKANFILGPGGINSWNCIAKYKKVRSLLNKKYGSYTFIRETKDPLLEDLLTSTPCYPISLGLREITTYWNKKTFNIEMLLMSDEEGFYIEITYTNLKREKTRNEKEKKKIIKKF